MAPPKGSAVYKKKDGTLTVSNDRKSVTWTPIAPRGALPSVTIQVSEITSKLPRVALLTWACRLILGRFAADSRIESKSHTQDIY
jgi:hypothetical protein